MNGIQAVWTMIAIAPVDERVHFFAAIGADKSCVFSFSTHTEPPDIGDVKYRKAGFCLFSAFNAVRA
jgi:hypothetical protein